ncbi:MAG: hypothetical protein Q7S58_01700 [Candidatus Binatus sp.]|uniref:hypothetical protein n=1 Tax=Candidatus Binatus sp. TaxID=2811406 RepID=UPI00271C6B8E|nr:hypothetical protein [Candidatus Binatus sp.]MDO8431104.1 hypothetical protein [Candidatus Binatus sp.]
MPAELDKIKERLRLATREHKALLVGQEDEIKRILESDSHYVSRERESNRQAVETRIAELQGLLETCKPFVIRIKSLVPNISDETIEAACYLLFCQVVQHFEALFVLAARGLSIPAGEMLRAIDEALGLILLFLVEGQDHPNLKKWFEGETIPNSRARKAAHRFFNEGRSEVWPVEETQAGIYAALSKYSHVSYAAVLESIDVYARDFDWYRVAGFNYANFGSLLFAQEMLRATITHLKQFYRFHLGDEESFRELERIRTNAA